VLLGAWGGPWWTYSCKVDSDGLSNSLQVDSYARSWSAALGGSIFRCVGAEHVGLPSNLHVYFGLPNSLLQLAEANEAPGAHEIARNRHVNDRADDCLYRDHLEILLYCYLLGK
jgi:hypothetical protein